jgi:hypothetical protein
MLAQKPLSAAHEFRAREELIGLVIGDPGSNDTLIDIRPIRGNGDAGVLRP